MTPILIGRDHAAGVLRAEVERAASSHGGLVLVTGEAGIGKTTLVTDAADSARAAGAMVLGGSCWDAGTAPGYWPWVQVVRALRRAATPQEWDTVPAAAAQSLSVLLGEATERADTDRRDDGFQLYDAVTTALVSISAHRPVLVVLDDLHWADAASLKLLAFAAQHAWFERLLIVGTYRDVEVEQTDHALRPLILPLVAKATTVTLTGLGRDEVGALIELTTGARPAAELVDEVHRRTGGNPFFVEQTARLWSSGGTVDAVAPGVREAVRRRLSLLPAPVGATLAAAAVLGRRFHRKVLAATVAEPVALVDRLLDHAVAARLVLVRGAGQLEFVHDLVRETLADGLDDARTRDLHAAVVRAMDESPGLADKVLPAETARHAYLAGAAIDPERTVRALRDAARDADARMAVDEAVEHYRRALEVVPDDAGRAMLHLLLAQELHWVRELDLSWRHFAEAADCARAAGDADLFARVAITVYRASEMHGQWRPATEPLLREAHRALSVGTADLSTEDIAQELILRATTLARQGDDDDSLAFSLTARHDTIWGPGTALERITLTKEIEAVARRTGERDLEQYAASLRWVALLELGDPAYLDQFDVYVALAKRYGTPRFRIGLLVDECILATLAGRFDRAQTLLDEVAALGEEENPDFGMMGHHLQWALSLLRGRFDDVDALLASPRGVDGFQLSLLKGISAAERGTVAETERYHAEVAAGPQPRAFASLGLRFAAQAAALSGDAGRCARVRAELVPHRGEWAVSFFGCDISGPMDHWLGVVDSALRRWDDAIEEFTASADAAEAMRMPPWQVQARLGLAGALLGRAGEGDAVRAAAVLAEVRRQAEELGMAGVDDRIGRLREAAQEAETPVAQEFRRDGAVWSLTFDGRSVHVPAALGLRDLHTLLASPGTDIPAVRLLAPEGGEVVVAARALGGDAMLDDAAKAAYKRRLDQLDDEIDSASTRGDDARAARLDAERTALLDELRTAAGLGGRGRRLGDEAERARKTVTARIRDTLRKLDERHPALAAHLRASVSTGSTCGYHPNTAILWRL